MEEPIAIPNRPQRQRQEMEPAALPIRPMLAQTFRGKLPKGLLFSQPKLDGVRCVATADGLWTRTGIRIISCAHIEAALRPVFDRTPGLILDGELYSHALCDDLQTIISLINTRRPCPEVRSRCAELIGFHIFDLPSHSGPFSNRTEALTRLMEPQLPASPSIALVDTKTVCDRAHLDALFNTYLTAGFEGQMIRQDSPYEETRTSRLLKRKPFEDAEFEVIKLLEVGGTHMGYAKRAILQLPDGRAFMAFIKGAHDYASSLLGQEFKSATVRYSSIGQSGIPRSPVIVAFHPAGSRI